MYKLAMSSRFNVRNPSAPSRGFLIGTTVYYWALSLLSKSWTLLTLSSAV